MKPLMSLGAIVLTSWFAIPAQAQQDLPSGKDVVERSVKEAGGKEAYAKVKTITMNGKLNVPESNVHGSINISYAAPDRARLQIDLGRIGKQEQGVNGKVGWEMAPNTGNRLMKDNETERTLDAVSLRVVFEPEAVYESMNNKGIENVNGQKCYKVEMKRKKGSEVDTVYYSVDSGLPVKASTNRQTALGESLVESTFENYKDVNGLKTPFKMSQHMKALNFTQVIDFETIEYNPEINDSVFKLPPQIKRMVK